MKRWCLCIYWSKRFTYVFVFLVWAAQNLSDLISNIFANFFSTCNVRWGMWRLWTSSRELIRWISNELLLLLRNYSLIFNTVPVSNGPVNSGERLHSKLNHHDTCRVKLTTMVAQFSGQPFSSWLQLESYCIVVNLIVFYRIKSWTNQTFWRFLCINPFNLKQQTLIKYLQIINSTYKVTVLQKCNQVFSMCKQKYKNMTNHKKIYFSFVVHFILREWSNTSTRQPPSSVLKGSQRITKRPNRPLLSVPRPSCICQSWGVLKLLGASSHQLMSLPCEELQSARMQMGGAGGCSGHTASWLSTWSRKHQKRGEWFDICLSWTSSDEC